MIHVFIGTKAQFIKMAPIMVELRARDIPFRYVDSGQHAEITRSLRRVFRLGDPDVSLRTDREDITTVSSAIRWYCKNLWMSNWQKQKLKQEIFPGGGVCLIHGDTLSTLLGMQMARAAGLDVAHVEAGLRSFRIWDPFPEELIRIRCMRRSQLLFAPSAEAEENLSRMNVRGKIVQIGGNTVIDSLRLMERVPATVAIPDAPFALVTCHRFETIKRKHRLARVVELVNRVAEQIPVIFVMHKPTRSALSRFGLESQLNPSVQRREMLDYCDFIALIKAAEFVLIDGGSIQEECAYLNKPCLILRDSTERSDGLGRNAMLWKFDRSEAEKFLSSVPSLTQTDVPGTPTPSSDIVDKLVERNYCDSLRQDDYPFSQVHGSATIEG